MKVTEPDAITLQLMVWAQLESVFGLSGSLPHHISPVARFGFLHLKAPFRIFSCFDVRITKAFADANVPVASG